MKKCLTRIVIAATATLVLVLGLASGALAAGWTDVTGSILAKYGVSSDDLAGISQGFPDGTWKPDQPVTRAQFAKMAVEAFDVAKANPGQPSFGDVSPTNYYYQWIEGAKAAGLINGVSDGAFAPDATMTHEQCFAVVARWVAKATKINTAQAFSAANTAVALIPYTDQGAVGADLRDEVAMAIKYGVYQPGDWGSTLAPQGQVTRIQAAAALVRGTLVDGDRLCILGLAAGPLFRVDMNNTGFMLVVNDAQYMVDCGSDCPQNIIEMGMGYGPLKNIFFTHLHLDHTAGYSDLLARGYAMNPSKLSSLDAWGPPGVQDLTDGIMSAFDYAFKLHDWGNSGNLPPVPVVHEFDLAATGIVKVMEDDNVVVTATRVYHDAEVKYAYAYRFDIKATGKSVVFSGDTVKSDALIALAKDATVMVHEAQDNDSIESIVGTIPNEAQRAAVRAHLINAHTDVKDVPAIAKAANVGTVVLNHYGAAAFVNAGVLYPKAVAAAQAIGYTGRVIAPQECDVIGF